MMRRIFSGRANVTSLAHAWSELKSTDHPVDMGTRATEYYSSPPLFCGHKEDGCVLCQRVASNLGMPMSSRLALISSMNLSHHRSRLVIANQQRSFSNTTTVRFGSTTAKEAPPTKGNNNNSNMSNSNTNMPSPSSNTGFSAAKRVVNTLHIGDVSLPIYESCHPERVASGLPPAATAFFNPNRPETLRYIRWLAQKDLLKQDVCIVGDPGPTKRWLAMLFAQYAGKEVQLLCLSRDTTEADIKQRKEIRDGTLYYVNQAAVTAALEGQLLIVDGLERAERNVLPVINNLLENREMHLDNGMMLIAPQRYDQLCAEHGVTDLSDWGLLRVSENFRVIGLTVPIPKFSGNPLDPPLRSRFQCLYLDQTGSSSSGSSSGSSSDSGATPTYLTYDVIPKAIRGTQPVETMLKFRAVQNTVDNAGSDRDRVRSFPAVTDFDIGLWSMQHEVFPNENLGEILQRIYPFELFIRSGPKAEQPTRRSNLRHLLKKYALLSEDCATKLESVSSPGAGNAAALKFTDGKERVVPCGSRPIPSNHPLFGGSSDVAPSADGDDHSSFFTDAHRRALTGLLQSHTCGRHVALVGSAGCGKTNLIREFASLLGYEVETQHLFRDMSTRDLLQRRATDPLTGSTTWELSPLMIAVKEGRLAVLDGIDQLSPGALAALQELLLDGNITLFDGTVFKNEKAYEELKTVTLGLSSDNEMNARGIFKVHPSFRLIATARYPTPDASAKKVWLTSDLVPLVDWHVLPDLAAEDVFKLLSNVTKRFAAAYSSSSTTGGDKNHYESVNLRASGVSAEALTERQSSRTYQEVLASLVELQANLAEMSRRETKIPTLTLRQLRHISKHVLVFPDDLFGILESSLLLPLTSPLIASQVKAAMAKCGITDPDGSSSSGSGARGRSGSRGSASSSNNSQKKVGNPFEVTVSSAASTKTICKSFGHEVMHITRAYTGKEKALVPHVPSFHANRLQLTLQAWIAKNLASGNNILLVGNQGVGKNKIVDQLLMEVGLPRHYLQLHRDTTVSSLTINPTVVEGKVMWEDSPLVKAVQQGHVLVVDEIDKAPVEVVHILKGLIEDREMRLGDGRKISGWATHDGEGTAPIRDPNVIAIHPDFRVIVLANPPGFPFHGNDFYRECGDLFSCFVVQNPDPSSQQELLQKIAPLVPPILITKLIMVFTELGALFAAGAIQYPFSLRELIAVVRHLQAFPRDGLYQALNNVFGFDLLNENTMNHVRRLLHQYIAPISQAQLRSGLGENLVAKETLLGKLLNFATFTVAPPASATDAKNLKASFGFAVGGNVEVGVESSTVGEESNKDTKKSLLKYSVCGDALSPSTAVDSSKDGSFTEKLGFADINHLLLAGESIVSARQSSSSTDVAAKKTILMTSRNRIIFLPTPAACGSIDGGLSTESQLLSGESANTAVVVDLGQSTISSELKSAIILGDSASLADAIFMTSTHAPTKVVPSSFSASEQRAIAHLLSESETTLSISTVAVGPSSSSSGTVSSGNNNTDAVSLATIKFKNVTAACTRLAGEGCVAVASHHQSAESANPVVLSFLYYGRCVEISGGALAAAHFTRVTRIDAISSQLFFIVGEGPSKKFVAGFLKLSVFRDRCEPYFHAVSITDLPPPAGKKLEDVDERIRLSALSIQNLLAADGSFSGISSGEGYIPTPGPLTADNLQNALFTMNPSTMTNRDGQTVHVIKPKDVLYATAKVETVSENGLLMVTLEGAVNRLEKPIQLAAANGRAVTGADSTSTSVALPIASEPSSWVKVAEYGTSVTAGASSAAAGAIGSNSHSHSAEFGHHQLVARDPNSSAVCVVSTQKGTIREFPTAYNGGVSGTNTGTSSIMEKARSLFGSSSQGAGAVDSGSLMTSVGPDGIGTTVSPSGAVTTFDTNAERLNEGYSRWNSVLKGGVEELGQPPTPEELNMWYSKPRKQADANNLKHGEEDPDNTPHSGGNNWAGGTGGTDTAGLGGLTGPYRLDKGHPVSQVDPAEKKKVPQHILDEARRMGKEALEKRLKEINMSVSEDGRYRDAFERVQGPVQQLRSMLEGLRSKERERAWMRHQTDGVWDDAKLVEGVTGEKTVYKRRIEADENMPFGKPEQKKRLLFVMDVSASMYRFNGMDQRLTKSVECAIMIMEAFKGFEEKIDYSIIGHNGDSGNLPLVPFGQPPTNKKQRMDVCMKMIAYSQYCWSGDNTVTAMEKSLDIVTAEPADGYFVFVISDANFQQYGISPAHLSRIIKAKDEVNMFCIFIASLGQQAKSIQQQLPAGHGFECFDTSRMPIVLQQIFQATDVLN